MARTTAVRLGTVLYTAVAERAKAEDRTVTVVVRRMVAAGLRGGVAPEPVVRDTARPLAGSVHPVPKSRSLGK